MKKIRYFLLFFLYAPFLFSSEKYKSLQNDIIKITTGEALCNLACVTQGDWDAFSTMYKVEPSAVYEYMKMSDQPKDQSKKDISRQINKWSTRDSSKYNKLVREIITEIRDKHSGNKHILQDMRKTFWSNLAQEIVKTQNKIDTMTPEYNRKKRDCLARAACNAAVACVVIGGWTLVGYFVWVIEHCH